MLWKALWSLVFGYAISAAIKVVVTRRQMARHLGARGLRQASLAASRSVFVKGAHPANALAFLVASTNLVIELGIVLWLLVGWRFTVANFALGLVMAAYAYALTHLWFPARWAKAAKRDALLRARKR